VERAVLVGSHDVAAIGRFTAVGRKYGYGAVFDFPPLGGECVFVGAYPTRVALSIEESFIATLLFICREAVRSAADWIDARWEVLRLEVVGLYTDVLEIYLPAGVGFIIDTVHLQPNEAGGVERVYDIGNRRAVYPRFGFIADGFDTDAVKVIVFIRCFGLLVEVKRVEPAPAGLVV